MGMPKSSGSRASKAKKLEALMRSQRINTLFQYGTNESEALLSSGGDSRQMEDSHLSDIFNDRERIEGEETRTTARPSRKKTKVKVKPKRKKAAKKAGGILSRWRRR